MFFGSVPPCRLNFRIARGLARSVDRFFFWCRPAFFDAPSKATHLLFFNEGRNFFFRGCDVAKCPDNLAVASCGVFAGSQFFARDSQKKERLVCSRDKFYLPTGQGGASANLMRKTNPDQQCLEID